MVMFKIRVRERFAPIEPTISIQINFRLTSDLRMDVDPSAEVGQKKKRRRLIKEEHHMRKQRGREDALKQKVPKASR